MIAKILPALLASMAWWPLSAEDALIRVETGGQALPVTATMTGACLEDVNHEVYGGIDSQMIFGEGFQEPSPPQPLAGAEIYGGLWSPADGTMHGMDTGHGPRLISGSGVIAGGRVGVDIRFATGGSGNAALLIAVGATQGVGSDDFDGYEIALLPAGKLAIGRHHHDYRLIGDVACPVPIGAWIPLEARIDAGGFEVFVDGRSLFRHADAQPLQPGGVGLRLWERDADFRGWWRDTGSGRSELPLAYRDDRPDWRNQAVSGMWRGFTSGTASGSFALTTDAPFTGRQSQRLAFAAGSGGVGIENRGLHRQGMRLRAQKPYESSIYVRAPVPAGLVVALQDAEGTRTLAEAALDLTASVDAGDGWRRLDAVLTPDADAADGRFAILLRQPGTADIGYAFLQPGDWGRFHGLPVRKDVADGLIAQGVTVLRYGGSMINHRSYRWKNMIGPRARRPGTPGTWYGYASNGWGIFEFLSLCEALGIAAIPDINCNESPQDVVDLIEYATGPADSTWGRRRAADGHPAPFTLDRLEIGNEEHIDDAYVAKFSAIAARVWALERHPLLVVGDFAYAKPVVDPFHLSGSDGAPTLAGHQRILASAKAHDQEVWFDMHVWTGNVRNTATIDALPSVIAALDKLADGARFKVCVFELNADTHDVGRAIQNAYAINRFTRLGGQVPVVCSANCLQVDGANDNGWDQGLLFMNAGATWPQPPYFVTQMQSRNRLPWMVPATSSHAGLDVTALVSDDRRIVQLEVVNRSIDQAIPASIDIGRRPTAIAVTTLAGAEREVNTAAQPEHILPTTATIAPSGDGTVKHVFPPLSFTVIRCE